MTDFQFDRLTSVKLLGIDRAYARVTQSFAIPRGRSQVYPVGVDAPNLALTCRATSASAIKQILEMQANPEWRFVYIQFPTGRTDESENDGWYVIESVDAPRAPNYSTTYFPFTLSVKRIATRGDYRIATYWKSSAESYSGWSSLTGYNLVTLPYNCTNVAWTVTEVRLVDDGSSQAVLVNPTRNLVHYKMSATLADWYRAECKVWDTVTAGDTVEANWVQVFAASHVFSGDMVLENGLMRYSISPSGGTGTFYGNDLTTLPLTWAANWTNAGQFKTALTGNLDAEVVHVEITRLTPEIIEWVEIRMNGVNPIKLTCSMRRASYFVRVRLETFALGIDTTSYIQLYKAGGYTKLFNSAANGNAGAGDLAQDATNNYECGYNTTDDMVSGFVLTEQPTKQPYDPGAAGNYLPLSLTLDTSDSTVFFIFAFSQTTSSFNLTTGRAAALAIAQQAMSNVEQELVLVPKGYYV